METCIETVSRLCRGCLKTAWRLYRNCRHWWPPCAARRGSWKLPGLVMALRYSLRLCISIHILQMCASLLLLFSLAFYSCSLLWLFTLALYSLLLCLKPSWGSRHPRNAEWEVLTAWKSIGKAVVSSKPCVFLVFLVFLIFLVFSKNSNKIN